MKEGRPLKEHLDELNSILMELREIDVKMEDEDLAMILLASLPPSYENFVSSLSVAKDSITLEEVKSNLHSRDLRLKESRNDDEAFVSGLSVTDFSKGQRRRKEKMTKRAKLILRASAITTKNRK